MTSCDSIIFQYLTRTGTGLYSLIAARAYYALPPEGFINTQAALVFRPEDGQSALWGVPLYERSYLIECWGGDASTDTWAGAESVYRALWDEWHDQGGVSVAAGTFLKGWEEQAAVPIVQPQTRLKYLVCRFGARLRGDS